MSERIHGIEETVARGICIGCGACAVASRGGVTVELGKLGMYSANVDAASPAQLRAASRVCPFSDESPNEDDLRAPHPGSPALPQHAALGQYSMVAAGRRTDDGQLTKSSSGGLTSWFTDQLLSRGLVDGVIHVGRAGGPMFAYEVSESADTTSRTRKSRYYGTTMADVLEAVRTDERTFAIVGVPCFIRAARALCREDAVLARRLKFFVGLVCGHMKSHAYAESLAWQVGIEPRRLGDVDFRVKNPARGAPDYDFAARADGDPTYSVAPTNSLVGTSWGHGAFQPEACNFCDDVFAETADVAFGDAWLPEYSADWRGTNVVVSRNTVVDEIMRDGAAGGGILVQPLTPERAAKSQAGGLRHRRQGLAVRLHDDLAGGLSVPRKRVEPRISHVGPNRRALIRLRRQISEDSHVLFAAAKERGDLSIYVRGMTAWRDRYSRLDRRSLRGRLSRLRRGLRAARSRLRGSAS